MKEEPFYRVFSLEHGQWWAPRGSGYTPDLISAGIYPRAEVTDLVALAALYRASRRGA